MFKPMLASPADLSKVKFPMLASAKLDGIRAIVIDGVVMSRSLKPIPSAFVQAKFSHLEGYDGELIVGDPTADDVYRQTNSHVMAKDKEDFDVKFFAFDHIGHPSEPYFSRRLYLRHATDVVLHSQSHVTHLDHLAEVEAEHVDRGYEGLIIRDPNAAYKFGRSTAKEGKLLKLKRFLDAEATVIGFEERMHNGNEATTNELGYTSRSSHAGNKIGLGDLGALIATYNGVQFSIGTGFDAEQRKEIWANRSKYIGSLVKFKFFPVGVKEKPRHPVFLGWRNLMDI